MRAKTSIYDFSFIPSGYGHYKVTYTSPVTGKQWTATTNDMPLIDATKNADKWLEEYEANNPEQLDTAEQLKKAEEHNRINALVVDYMAKKKQKEAAEKTARTFEDKLDALAKERETLIATSKLPIAGLSFTDDGLELNGVPFVAGKVSDSQIMEVAAKLIIASNPTVKVFRIARGESLGEKRLQAIIDIAKANGFQGFIEEVKRGQTDLVVEEYTENE